MNSPASRAGRIEAPQPPAGGATGTRAGGSATAALAPAPWVVRRLAGLSAMAAELGGSLARGAGGGSGAARRHGRGLGWRNLLLFLPVGKGRLNLAGAMFSQIF